MEQNKELKIAIIVGIIMITICLLVFIFYKANTDVQNIDLKVYKLFEKEDASGEHEYRECRITTDELIDIKYEYNRATSLTESNRVIGEQIMGEYKIISGENYIAFDIDEEKKLIYRGDTKYLYYFEGSLYDYAVNACN